MRSWPSAGCGTRGPGRFLPGSWSITCSLLPCSSRIPMTMSRRTWWGRWRGWARRSRTSPRSPGLGSGLGAGVIEAVFRRLAGPVAPAGLDGAFWRGMRVAAVDGFVLDVPDTPVNRAAFGGPSDAKGQPAGFPQARVVTLTETGTHSSIDAQVGGFRAGEPELATAMAGSAAGM